MLVRLCPKRLSILIRIKIHLKILHRAASPSARPTRALAWTKRFCLGIGIISVNREWLIAQKPIPIMTAGRATPSKAKKKATNWKAPLMGLIRERQGLSSRKTRMN
jgi:hypothetical protein